MHLLVLIIQCIWMGLPGGFANIVAGASPMLLPKFDYPMDFNLSIKGIRIFGSHKTMRGLILGMIASTIIFSIQKYLFVHVEYISNISLFDYTNYPTIFGALFGFGALLGDAIKSFFKRRVGIPPGHPWFPFDQIDWTVGIILTVILFINLPLIIIIISMFLGLFFHLIFKVIGFILKLDKKAI